MIIESKPYYIVHWINMLLLHKHQAIGHKIEIFELENDNWMKSLNQLNIRKNLSENRNIEYKRLIVMNKICHIIATWLTVIKEIFKFSPHLGPFCQIKYLLELSVDYPN